MHCNCLLIGVGGEAGNNAKQQTTSVTTMLTSELCVTTNITNQYEESHNVYPGMCSYPLPPLVMHQTPWNSQWVPINW